MKRGRAGGWWQVRLPPGFTTTLRSRGGTGPARPRCFPSCTPGSPGGREDSGT